MPLSSSDLSTEQLKAAIEKQPLPRHIAIIMDGNGRWAQQQGLPRVQGHYQGATCVRTISRCCSNLGMDYLTVFAFSEENWSRPQSETDALMELLGAYLVSEIDEMNANNIRLDAIGNIDRLPVEARKRLDECKAATSSNDGMLLTLALSYSGRDEIVRAARKIAEQGLAASDITAETIEAALDTAGYADPDLLIRTSGEMRISNFMLWQIAYAELVVTDTLWPDFGPHELYLAIQQFQQRERRFGGIRTQQTIETAKA